MAKDVNFSELDVMPDVVRRVEELRTNISDAINVNGLRASGRTQASMRIETKGDRVTLVGRKAFANLERGTPPLWGKMGFTYFRRIIAQWAKDKGLNWGSDHDRVISAITAKILHKGTRTFIRGGRRDIVTPYVDKCVADVNEIATLFWNSKVQNYLKIWCSSKV